MPFALRSFLFLVNLAALQAGVSMTLVSDCERTILFRASILANGILLLPMESRCSFGS